MRDKIDMAFLKGHAWEAIDGETHLTAQVYWTFCPQSPKFGMAGKALW